MFIENKKILDCTFRDGGYYTNWIFKKDVLEDYLKLSDTGICDIVEIGLRTIKSGTYLGPFAYSTFDYFSHCRDYKNIEFSTLINWSDISNSFNDFVNLFPGVDIDFVSIVRIVIKSIDIPEVEKYIKFLKDRGYKVCINIQNCDQLISANKEYLSEKISFLNPDIFYLADTNGCLNPSQTKNLIEFIALISDKPIGVHFHNNQGLAYANALQAIESGASYIDSTLTGIGRGAGNTQTEFLTYFLKDLSLDQVIKISEIIEKYFLPLKKEYLWGENYFYFLSGSHNQSASLMHNLINNKAYSEKSLIKLATSSQNDSISTLIRQHESNNNNYLMNKPEAIIIANGQDWLIERNQIIEYLKTNDLETLHINYPKEKNILPLIKGFCSCDPIKIINDYKLYSKSKKTPLICPLNVLEKLEIDQKEMNIIDYSCKVVSNKLEININECTIPSVQSLCYCLVYLYSKGYKNILLVGVQGFKDEKKNYEAISFLNLINIQYPDLQITSISKNCLGIKSKSIFEIRNL